MSETPAYNPEKEFEKKLQTGQEEGMKQFDQMLSDRFDWSLRSSSDWGKAAENHLKGLYSAKSAELTAALLILNKQEGTQDLEVRNLQEKYFLDKQSVVLNSIKERFEVMLMVAAQKDPGGAPDKIVSSTEELARLRRVMRQAAEINVQQMLYDKLTPEMQAKFEANIVQTFGADLYVILEKTVDNEPLEEPDWKLLLTEVAQLGANQDSIRDSSVMVVLGNLSKKNRTEFVRRMVNDATFPNATDVIISMVAADYLETAQANAALEPKIARLNQELLDTKRKDKKDLVEEITHLQGAMERINGRAIKVTQEHTREVRKDTSKFMDQRAYGHKNHVRSLLTGKGLISTLVAANGAVTILANVLPSVLEPWEIPSNPAFWLGVAQVGAATQLSNVGIMPVPSRIAAKLAKDKNEERDDHVTENKENFKNELNNHDKEAIFYANYAERIALFYNTRKAETRDAHVKITLEDIGIKSREEVPEPLRPLLDRRQDLERLISEWAYRFAYGDLRKGMAITQGENQKKFIQQTRLEADLDLPDYEIPLFEDLPE